MVAPKSGKVITVLVMRPITEGQRGRMIFLLDSRENGAAQVRSRRRSPRNEAGFAGLFRRAVDEFGIYGAALLIERERVL